MSWVDVRKELTVGAPVLLVVAMLVLFGANDRWLLSIATIGHFLVGLLVLAGSGDRPGVSIGRLLPVLLPFAAAMAWAAIPLLSSSPIHASSQQDVALVLTQLWGLSALAAAGAVIGRSPDLTSVFWRWLLVAGLFYLWAALTVRAIDPGSSWSNRTNQIGRFTGTMLNANVAGCSFGMVALLGIGQIRSITQQGQLYIGRAGTFVRFGAAVLSSLIGIAACAASQSRFALLLTGAGVFLLLTSYARTIRSRRNRKGFLWLVGAAAALLLLSFGIETTHRALFLSADAQSRFAAYRALIEISARSPWLGYGLGSFPEINLTKAPPALLDTMWNWGAAHNIVLHAALEAGWPFAILIGLTLASMRFAGERCNSADPMMQSVDAAILLAIGCSMVDIALNVPAIASFTTLLLGVRWGARLPGGKALLINYRAHEVEKRRSSPSPPSPR